MDLADVTDSKSVGATRVGSSPTTGTKEAWKLYAFQAFSFCKYHTFETSIWFVMDDSLQQMICFCGDLSRFSAFLKHCATMLAIDRRIGRKEDEK